jgi:hypothetical protein
LSAFTASGPHMSRVPMYICIHDGYKLGGCHIQRAMLMKQFAGVPTGQTAPTDSSIQVYLDSLVGSENHHYFRDTSANSSARESGVKDNVLLILGTWLLSQSYFTPAHQDQRRIVYAYCLSTDQEYSETTAFGQSVAKLIAKSGLLPSAGEGRRASDDDDVSSFQVVDGAEVSDSFPLHSHTNLLESLAVDSKKLNAVTLSTYSHVEIAWTQNISRHMLLSKRAGSYYLEIFALPCALQGGAEHVLAQMGIPTDLIDEIECSYATLFNPSSESATHKILAWMTGLRHWCWCLYCTGRRFRKRTLETLKKTRHGRGRSLLATEYSMIYDDQVRVLMEREASQWNQTDFSNLWPRILALDAHLRKARPWNFWVLFRDKRDTVQYWTFL